MSKIPIVVLFILVVILVAVLAACDGPQKDSQGRYLLQSPRPVVCYDGVAYIRFGDEYTAKFTRHGQVETCD